MSKINTRTWVAVAATQRSPALLNWNLFAMLASRSRIYRHAINQRLGYDPRLYILRPARANETRSLQTV